MEMESSDCKPPQWDISASKKSKRTVNPIRQLIDNLKLEPNKDKEFIALSIGDPTVFGNLPPNNNVLEQTLQAVKSGKFNGYGPSFGHLSTREAVVSYVRCPDYKPDPKNVIMTSGASSALDLSISVLADPGENVLIPRPGFSIYKVICDTHDIGFKYYDLRPERNWEIDLNQLEGLIDNRTRAIIVNNPSNPCGSVFSREHIRAIGKIAEKHRIPIIADEIYADFVFENVDFAWFAEEMPNVPILSCGGIAKRYLVPGWRLGWVVLFDRNKVLEEVRNGLVALSQVILGPNTTVQGALPKIISDTPPDFFKRIVKVIEKNAGIAFNCLNGIKGLKPIMPQGAMYMMCSFDMSVYPKFTSDLNFVERMVSEQSVFVLPGKCFEYPNSFRIVLTVPEEKLEEACNRIHEFCISHMDPMYCKHITPPKKIKIDDDMMA